MPAFNRRALQIDATGTQIHHTHTKVDASEPRPPMKYHLCTPQLRPEGRMTQADIDAIGDLMWKFAKLTNLPIKAIACVPRVGDELAKAFLRASQKDGVTLPKLLFSKYMENDVSLIGPLQDNDGYEPSQEVWLFDDVVHRSLSKQRTKARAVEAGYRVRGIFVFMDYDQGAQEHFREQGIDLQRVITIRYALQCAINDNEITAREYRACMSYLDKTRGGIM
ncbi:MAG: hypothetical protein WA021_05675 [Minisyncoccia bacterium]